jgi:hypothetical protein
MKTLTIAIIAAAGAVTAAHAAPLERRCALTEMKSGSDLSYRFMDGPGKDWIEMSIAKNGSVLTHGNGNRPVWIESKAAEDRFMMMTYNPDRRFALGVSVKLEKVDGIYTRKAALVKSGTVVARGSCSDWGGDDEQGTQTRQQRRSLDIEL